MLKLRQPLIALTKHIGKSVARGGHIQIHVLKQAFHLGRGARQLERRTSRREIMPSGIFSHRWQTTHGGQPRHRANQRRTERINRTNSESGRVLQEVPLIFSITLKRTLSQCPASMLVLLRRG